MRYTDEPDKDWDAYCREMEAARQLLPRCDECGELIEDEFCFQIGDAILCEDCIDQCRKHTTDLIL